MYKNRNKIPSKDNIYKNKTGYPQGGQQKEEREMGEKGVGFMINFIVRAILGMAVIFFVNQFLEYQEISVSVGLNGLSFLTSGFLGLPGVALLYGILFWKNL